MQKLRIGLVGSGAAARMHAIAYRNVPMTFGPKPAIPELAIVVSDAEPDRSVFECPWTPDWKSVVEDENIDIIAIASPVDSRAEIAGAAAVAGKHIYCDQPIARSSIDAAKVLLAVEKNSVVGAASFIYLKNPAQTLARRLISEDKIGVVTKVRIVFDTDASDASDLVGDLRAGTLSTLGGDAVAFAKSLIGDIEAVCGVRRSIGGSSTSSHPATEDLTQFLVRFANGALGVIGCNRRCAGKKLGLSYEIQGTKGALRFSQERMNEIEFYDYANESWRRGYQTLYSGPIDPLYAGFHPIPGLSLSHVDQKTIEVRALIEKIFGGNAPVTSMRFAYETARVVDAVMRSDNTGGWVNVGADY